MSKEPGSRTFQIAAAGLGCLIVLSLVCLGVYALILQPQQREAALPRPTDIVLTNTAVALGLTQTAEGGSSLHLQPRFRLPSYLLPRNCQRRSSFCPRIRLNLERCQP